MNIRKRTEKLRKNTGKLNLKPKLPKKDDNLIKKSNIEEPKIPQKKVNDFLLEAKNYYDSNKIKAIEILEDALKVSPNSLTLFFNLGLLYSDTNQHKKSISAFEKVLTLQPNNLNVLYNLGNEHFFMKNFERSFEIFKYLSKYKKNDIDVLYNAGFVCFKHLGKYDEAINYFDQVLNLEVNQHHARYNKALCFFFKKEFESCISELETLIKNSPNYAPAYYNLGVCCMKLEKFDQALLYFEDYMELPKGNEQKPYIREAYNFLRFLKTPNKF